MQPSEPSDRAYYEFTIRGSCGRVPGDAGNAQGLLLPAVTLNIGPAATTSVGGTHQAVVPSISEHSSYQRKSAQPRAVNASHNEPFGSQRRSPHPTRERHEVHPRNRAGPARGHVLDARPRASADLGNSARDAGHQRLVGGSQSGNTTRVRLIRPTPPQDLPRLPTSSFQRARHIIIERHYTTCGACKEADATCVPPINATRAWKCERCRLHPRPSLERCDSGETWLQFADIKAYAALLDAGKTLQEADYEVYGGRGLLGSQMDRRKEYSWIRSVPHSTGPGSDSSLSPVP